MSEVGDTIFNNFLGGVNSDLSQEINQFTQIKINDDELKKIITQAFEDEINFSLSTELVHKQIMGKVMKKCRGIIPGKIINKQVWQEMESRGVK